MKLLIPVILALLGLGTGVGAGLVLKPAPAEADMAHAGEAHCAPAEGDAEEECAPAKADPFDGHPKDDGHKAEKYTYVPIEKPFIVPVFSGEKVAAMVVMSLSVATDEEAAKKVTDIAPRLRDRFLNVMFLHSNTGGFDGSFTQGRKMEDLKSALLKAAREVLDKAPVGDVLITDIVRQDV